MSMKKTLGLDMKIVEGGAWIETTVSFTRIPAVGVAPRAGAWIETGLLIVDLIVLCVAPPIRGRGLKH